MKKIIRTKNLSLRETLDKNKKDIILNNNLNNKQEKDISILNSKINSLNTGLENVKNDIIEIKEEISNIDTNGNDLSIDLSNYVTKTELNNSQQTQNTEFNNAINSLNDTFTEGLDNLGHELNSIDSSFNNYTPLTLHTELSNQVETNTDSIVSIQNQVRNINIPNYDSQINDLSIRITTAQNTAQTGLNIANNSWYYSGNSNTVINGILGTDNPRSRSLIFRMGTINPFMSFYKNNNDNYQYSFGKNNVFNLENQIIIGNNNNQRIFKCNNKIYIGENFNNEHKEVKDSLVNINNSVIVSEDSLILKPFINKIKSPNSSISLYENYSDIKGALKWDYDNSLSYIIIREDSDTSDFRNKNLLVKDLSNNNILETPLFNLLSYIDNKVSTNNSGSNNITTKNFNINTLILNPALRDNTLQMSNIFKEHKTVNFQLNILYNNSDFNQGNLSICTLPTSLRPNKNITGIAQGTEYNTTFLINTNGDLILKEGIKSISSNIVFINISYKTNN